MSGSIKMRVMLVGTEFRKSDLADLPQYLRDALIQSLPESDDAIHGNIITVLTIDAIAKLHSRSAQLAYLLLLRHDLTQQIGELDGLYPPYIVARAEVYAALGYADLAAADANVALTLCEVAIEEEWVSDLQPLELSGETWPNDGLESALLCRVQSLTILCRALHVLGATVDSSRRRLELARCFAELHPDMTKDAVEMHLQELLQTPFCIQTSRRRNTERDSKFGWSRREVYPWNEHEPDRNSAQSIATLNASLSKVAPHLEARVTALPSLDGAQEPWMQLGLFAKEYLAPGTTVLREKSVLTAIRPLEDSLCDACGLDLEGLSIEALQQCPGQACDMTFCSIDCASRAAQEYHKPNTDQDDEEELESDYAPASAPFCGNDILQEIGRTTSTDTAEWDLYFLLMTRTVQMALTQERHPLNLSETRYLWGDFVHGQDTQCILPFSLYHNVALPLQFFETLMHSLPEMRPYSKAWLTHFDWWIIQTMYAKYRGVANAQQSTYDGKAEIAAVHPMWCLANHSCEPNVRWTPTGKRQFHVLPEQNSSDVTNDTDSGRGIEAGHEIWSHYTDISLPVHERRKRLKEVLGGTCCCPRCLREANSVT